MINQMLNDVVVEGKVNKINLEDFSFEDKEHPEITRKAIRGEVEVKVVMPIEKGGEPIVLMIPIRVFKKQYSKKGLEENKEDTTYLNLKKLMDEKKSIATVGEDEAECVRFTHCNMVMAEFPSKNDGTLVTFPQISGTFMNFVSASEMSPKAKVEMEGIIHRMSTRMVGDVEYLDIICANVGWGETTHLIPFTTCNSSYIAAFQEQYEKGDPIDLTAVINFSATVETITKEVAIGEPEVITKTRNKHDLVISSAKNAMLNVDEDELKSCLDKREQRIAEVLARRQAPVGSRTKEVEKQKVALGF